MSLEDAMSGPRSGIRVWRLVLDPSGVFVARSWRALVCLLGRMI